MAVESITGSPVPTDDGGAAELAPALRFEKTCSDREGARSPAPLVSMLLCIRHLLGSGAREKPMDWYKQPIGTSAHRGRLRGFEAGRHVDGKCIAAHLPLGLISSAPSSAVNTIPTWRAPPIQRDECGGGGDEDEDPMTGEYPTEMLEPPLGASPVVKNSRYLRERDRRSILLRIDRGEKQSNLAREYKVTRAAICYLKKHRSVVLARTSANPMAKHPKKPRQALRRVVTPPSPDLAAPINFALPSLAALLLPKLRQAIPCYQQESTAPQLAQQSLDFVHKIKTRSMQLLLTKIENIATSPAEFQRNINRMMHLLTEEALASCSVATFAGRNGHLGGYTIANPSCAISMMAAACPMLSILNQLEPEFPSGYAHVHRVDQSSHPNMLSVDLTSSNLPATLKGHNAFVMDLVSGSGHQLCAVIAKLVQRGANTRLVTVVSLFSSGDAIAMVHHQFPGVRFVVVKVDPPVDTTSAWPRCPSRGRQFWKWFAHLYKRN